jgi:selenocysteine lyase/cysteine desulfurase
MNRAEDRVMSFFSSRRTFINGVIPAAAALAKFPALLNAAAGAESYWTLVRSHFPFSDTRVPMNAANLCPSPRAVSDRAAALTRDMDFDCSARNREKFTRLLEESRTQIASQLGVTADEIALVRNTSEANNIINNGLPLKAGDEVVLWDQNHPTNNVAWDVRAARFGLVVKRVSTPESPARADDLVGVFERAITPRTRVLAITYLSNVSGIRLPAKQICQLARSRGVYIHVDGAQAWGAFQLDLRDLGCDSFSASSHKWFMGPREVGLLYVRNERIAEIWPNTVAPGWGTDAEPDVAGARKFESLGQRDDAKLAAIRIAADFHASVGIAAVESRMLALASALKTSVRALDLPLATPMDPALSGGVVIIRGEAGKAKRAYELLDDKWGIAGAATGGLRLCPHIYNTMAHIERAAEGIKSMRELFV